MALGCKGYREIGGMVPEFKLLWCIWRDTWRIEEREVNDEEGEAKSGTEIQRRSNRVGQRIWREHAGGVRPSAGLRMVRLGMGPWEGGHGKFGQGVEGFKRPAGKIRNNPRCLPGDG